MPMWTPPTQKPYPSRRLSSATWSGPKWVSVWSGRRSASRSRTPCGWACSRPSPASSATRTAACSSTWRTRSRGATSTRMARPSPTARRARWRWTRRSRAASFASGVAAWTGRDSPCSGAALSRAKSTSGILRTPSNVASSTWRQANSFFFFLLSINQRVLIMGWFLFRF